MVRINIDGPIGNAYAVLGLVHQYCGELGWDKKRQEEIKADMKAPGDYQGLIDGFNKHFDGLVELYSQNEEEGYYDDCDDCEDAEYLD